MSLFLTQMVAIAQDEPPAPQFLYRSDNHLILLDGYTGKTTPLPIEVTEKDHFAWSPDGQYLLSRLNQAEDNSYCLNLYDVDKQKWTNDKPISCTVQEAVFSNDTSQIFYSTSDKANAILWKYNLKDKLGHEVYQTTNGDDHYPSGIAGLKWSPTGSYLTFSDYKYIMGGSINSFVVLNVANEKHIYLNAADSYYASYSPIWSADNHWFLVTLQDAYVISGSLPFTNQQGDVYLINSDTGENYRITYTPAEQEVDVHWTDDGKIAFSIFTEQKFTFSIEQAMNVKVVPFDEIVQPEPVDRETAFPSFTHVTVSPDPRVGAWITQTVQEGNQVVSDLEIGDIFHEQPMMPNFSVPISDPDKSDTILIGWRPSNYPYPKDSSQAN